MLEHSSAEESTCAFRQNSGSESIEQGQNLTKTLTLTGSPGRTRTADQVINSHLLYRLSYRGMSGAYTTYMQ
jgi:hypothetical protein